MTASAIELPASFPAFRRINILTLLGRRLPQRHQQTRLPAPQQPTQSDQRSCAFSRLHQRLVLWAHGSHDLPSVRLRPTHRGASSSVVPASGGRQPNCWKEGSHERDNERVGQIGCDLLTTALLTNLERVRRRMSRKLTESILLNLSSTAAIGFIDHRTARGSIHRVFQVVLRPEH